MKRRVMMLLLLCGSLAGLPASAPSFGAEGRPRRTSLVTVQGVVQEISTRPGEGGLDVVMVTLQREDPGSAPFKLLLAPEKTLEEIGFEVQRETGSRFGPFSPVTVTLGPTRC